MIYHESNYHDNRYYHDISLANSDSITNTKIVNNYMMKYFTDVNVFEE